MKGVSQQQHHQVVVVVEEGEKEKEKEKKKRMRRSNRRSKQSTPPLSGTACSSTDGTTMRACKVLEKYISFSKDGEQPITASNSAFNSLPPTHNSSAPELGTWSNQFFSPCPLEGKSSILNFRSCPEPSFSCGKVNCLPKRDREADKMQNKYFASHLSIEDANKAVERGAAFRASFRVNAHNRLEAYCTVNGVPTDILISGVVAQNRAVERDIVAIMLDPETSWTCMKACCLENSIPMDDFNVVSDVSEMIDDNSKGKENVDSGFEYPLCGNTLLQGSKFSGEVLHLDMANGHKRSCNGSYGQHSTTASHLNGGLSCEQGSCVTTVEEVCALLSAFPSKRPTGKVLTILEMSPRRESIIGFLSVKQFISYKEGYKKEVNGHLLKKNQNPISFGAEDYIQLTPTDSRLPKMMVPLRSLPAHLRERLKKRDETVGTEVVAARIDDWREECSLPQAEVMHVFGRCGEIEPQIAAIVFENNIYSGKFSSDSLACVPEVTLELQMTELQKRKDLRDLCMFTIDPSSACELDDALSIERISDDRYRVGVHITDVSYFVQPDTSIDKEAQIRSGSVHLLQHKLPMLPPQLSEDICSLNPGMDRFAFSMIWEINQEGDVMDRWIGRTVIRSCCKLSYSIVQTIIDGSFDAECFDDSQDGFPKIHGQFRWPDISKSIGSCHEISKKLKEKRFRNGALWLESSKLGFLFDEHCLPYDSVFSKQTDSNYLVEEFMLLANRTAAEVISRAFPDCALLCRHPAPNRQKLKEFEAFCCKHGFELDASSSAQLHLSLLKIREKLKSDPIMFDILISYASKSMQLAAYFNSGDLKENENEWAHYSLAVPLYTHFTSPLHRYPDIIVHRALAAAIEAERICIQMTGDSNNGGSTRCGSVKSCFTGILFDKETAESKLGKDALLASALKYKVPTSKGLTDLAAYCNIKKLSSRHAEEAAAKLYLWTLLRKKEALISDARVLGLGPKFMSVYIERLAMERRIYYDEVEGLIVDWLETTSTLVLDLLPNKRIQKRGSPGKFRPLEEVAYVVYPCSTNCGKMIVGDGNHELKTTLTKEGQPDAGGDGAGLDIGTKLYLSSYFSR
ncbi:DIS3-like exonuclease 2 isoform X2 [Aristolochia californica]|uniref:DIS3-like exonuclease 2 isoform X2 n=1 Tax=Aristolochia californica TaxID=171875 RepID=UPI0035E37BAC